MRVSDWYPILSNAHGLRNPGDSQVSAAATSITLDLTTDRTLTVAAPGRLVEHRGRRRVYRLENARNHGFVAAPRLRRLSTTTRDGVRVRVFHTKAVSARNARFALREARRALERYDDAYGPYPWPELIVAPTPGGWIATEWPSIVFMGSQTYGDAEVVHHEVAHQWFYALLGNDQLREPWVERRSRTSASATSSARVTGRSALASASTRPSMPSRTPSLVGAATATSRRSTQRAPRW